MGHPALIGTVFERLDRHHIQSDPFPHAVIDDALPPEQYRRLAETRPAGQHLGPNRRSALPGWMLASMEFVAPEWQRFATRHMEPSIPSALADVFALSWTRPLPPSHALNEMKTAWLGADISPPGPARAHADAQADLFLDCRLETIGASPSAAGSHRRQHLDRANRLFSALFYLREPDDDTEGGGLALYRWKKGVIPNAFDAEELPSSAVETAKIVPYAANTLVVFPNSPNALHGAEQRAATRFQRHYVFVTAERPTDLW